MYQSFTMDVKYGNIEWFKPGGSGSIGTQRASVLGHRENGNVDVDPRHVIDEGPQEQ